MITRVPGWALLESSQHHKVKTWKSTPDVVTHHWIHPIHLLEAVSQLYHSMSKIRKRKRKQICLKNVFHREFYFCSAEYCMVNFYPFWSDCVFARCEWSSKNLLEKRELDSRMVPQGEDLTNHSHSTVTNRNTRKFFMISKYLLKRCFMPHYRSGTVNSKSFVGKVLLRIKWKFELTYAL